METLIQVGREGVDLVACFTGLPLLQYVQAFLEKMGLPILAVVEAVLPAVILVTLGPEAQA
jgi:hypothetical protein